MFVCFCGVSAIVFFVFKLVGWFFQGQKNKRTAVQTKWMIVCLFCEDSNKKSRTMTDWQMDIQFVQAIVSYYLVQLSQ